MTAIHRAVGRPFLDVTEAETSADPAALADALSKAALDAERLGLLDVKKHIETALAHVVDRGENEGGS